jgi:hypothetical protein
MAEETEQKHRLELKHGAEFILRDKDGNIRQEGKVGDIYDCEEGDLIVDAGIAGVAGALGDINAGFTYMAIGTDATAPAVTQTALVAETHREAATMTQETDVLTDDTMVASHIFTGYIGSESVEELGLLNATTAGTMLCRLLTGGVACDWGAGDSVELKIKVVIS